MQPVVPDVFVREGPDGSWHVELNSDTLPRLLVNQSYYAAVSAHGAPTPTRSYLADCLHNANWLVKSLDQRAQTILKVASEIVRQQDAFLAHGVEHLRPLNLKTVAEAIGMHESTVSRVTSNKYMATPRHVRAQIFLHRLDRRRRWRRSAFGRGGAPPDRELIEAEAAATFCPTTPSSTCCANRRRHRAPHRRQVSRGDAHPLVGATPARKTSCSGRLIGRAVAAGAVSHHVDAAPADA